MKFSFGFSNLYGTVYRKGNLLFTPDGNTVISPVGNKISLFDLKSHKSETLPIESRFNYCTVALSPNGLTLIAVNEEGEIHLISLISRTILHKLRTNRDIVAVEFSPDSRHFALTKEDAVFVYRNPGPGTRDYSPFVMERVLKGAYDETTCLTWSSCSRILAVGSKDMTVRIYALEKFKNFTVCSLGGMVDPVVGAYFEEDSLDCYSVSAGGQLAVWESSLDLVNLERGERSQQLKTEVKKEKKEVSDDDEGIEDGESAQVETVEAGEKATQEARLIYKRSARHFLRDHVEEGGRTRVSLTCSDFHRKTKILVVGFDSGTFLLLSLPDASLIHSLAISDQTIGAVNFNSTGDWIAFGCPDLGQLLVWEWQSETYVLKQQGHSGLMSCLSYSPDGSLLATGGDDAKVKLWNTSSGFCFVTFSEHESGVTGVCFTPNGKVVLSASLDGTVRAFDLARYRNFKTFTTPRPVQLSCISVDASGDLIVAGGQDVFEIYLWSLTTGRLVDILSGHEGPVSALAFSSSPTSSQLASVSWDKTLKIWDALESTSHREAIELVSEGIAVAWRPDSQAVSVSTLSGQILTFETTNATQVGCIVGKKDLRMGKGESDKISAKKKSESSYFSSLCYSADGTSLLAGGNSKFICIYHVKEQLLMKKFEVTQNRSFDSMDDTINRRKMTDFGNLALIEDRSDGTNLKLPGTKKVDMSTRNFKMEIRVSCLRFSPTGRAFSAVTSEGLLVYSLDRHLVFDPFFLETKITPHSIRKELADCDYNKAIVTSFKLNEVPVIREVFENIPSTSITLLAKELPLLFLGKVLNFLAEELEETRHFEFYLKWCLALLNHHGGYLKTNSSQFLPVLNMLVKNMSRKSDELGKVCDHNKYSIRYLLAVARRKKETEKDTEMVDSDDSDNSEEDIHADDDDVGMEELKAKWSDDGDESDSD